MTIQEAIKSGKPFRRGKWWHTITCYLMADKRRIYIGMKPNGKRRYTPIVDDILALDWEVKP